MDGIRVNRVALYPSHDNSSIRRIVNYLSFSFFSLLIGPWLVRKPDVIYVYNLITLSWTARFLRWLHKSKIVYDIQDLWPESVSSSGMLNGGVMSRVLSSWSNQAYKKADHMVVLSPGFQANLLARGISADKIDVIYNWCQEADAAQTIDNDACAVELGLDNPFNVMFAGTMGVMQGLDTVLDAAHICKETVPDACFIFVGGGTETERLQERSRKLNLNNVFFVERQPMARMGRIFSCAAALLVHLKDNTLFRITVPSKTQAYLAAGRPIIMAVQGDAADLIERAEAGFCCSSENPKAIADCVEKLYTMPRKQREALGTKGREFYQENLSFHCGVDKFESLFQSLLEVK
jgi:glycosyltransferase involved in cell wall biosynthesis